MKDKTLKQLVESIKASGRPKTSAYDTTATVTRVEGQTAWVHIPGGVRETPVKLTINAQAGDTVQVRVSGGRAFMVGNATAPPTDDRVANKALNETRTITKVVRTVQKLAERTAKIAGNTNQYFWHTKEGTDTGAHITEIPQEEFLADPENGGGNLLARSNGIAVRDGLDELAVFAADNIQLRDKIGRDLFVVGFDSGESSVTYSKPASSPTQTSITLKPQPKDGTNIIFQFAYTRNGTEYNNSVTFMAGTASTQTLTYVSVSYTITANGHRVIVSPRSASSCRAVSVKYVIQAYGIRFTLGWRDATQSSGIYSSVIGVNCSASGSSSVATNGGTAASGDYSFAMGEDTKASGRDSLSANRNTEAVGDYSNATGYYTKATGNASEAHGWMTQAFSDKQMVFGQYNEPDNNDEYALIIGNGTDNSNRSNALTVDWDGVVDSHVRDMEVTWETGQEAVNYHCVVSAGMCHLFYQGPITTHSVNTLLGSLPVGARPRGQMFCPFVKAGLAYGTIRIEATGEIYVGFISSTTVNNRIYFNCSFPVV